MSPTGTRRRPKAADETDVYPELRTRLVEQLADMRAQFQEAVASYSVRVQGELADVGDMLGADDPATLSKSERAARAVVLRAALDRVMALKLKPAKGRRRDLKAVQELASQLSSELSDW